MPLLQLIVMKFSENEVIVAKDLMCKNSDNVLQYQRIHNIDQRNLFIYDGLKNYQIPTSRPYLLVMVLECPGCPSSMLKITQMYLSLRRSLLLSVNLPRFMNL